MLRGLLVALLLLLSFLFIVIGIPFAVEVALATSHPVLVSFLGAGLALLGSGTCFGLALSA